MTTNVKVREATSQDLDATASIIAADAGGSVDEWRQRFVEVLANQSRLFLVAEVDGDVAGFGQARFITRDASASDAAPSGWFLTGVTVASAYRRRGVGIALTMARLERLPGKAVHYAAEAQNTATIRLHELLGFRVIGEIVLPGHDHAMLLFRRDPDEG